MENLPGPRSEYIYIYIVYEGIRSLHLMVSMSVVNLLLLSNYVSLEFKFEKIKAETRQRWREIGLETGQLCLYSEQ